MSSPKLGVWIGDRRVATLDARKPWDIRCRYESWVIETGLANRPFLSCSLPVSRQSTVATPWARGLLPEGNHLLALATEAGVPTNYYAHLLDRFGRDIGGAFSVSKDAPLPQRWDIEPYTEESLAEELRLVTDAPGFGIRYDSELSIAGLQNKLLLVVSSESPIGWGRPRNGQPSTHIAKLGDARYPGLIEAEHACMRIAFALGITTVTTDMVNVGGVSALIVQRFDRTIDTSSGLVSRTHQEDACQALGTNIDAHQGRGKYQRYGGPSFQQIAALLEQHGTSAADAHQLLRCLVFTIAIGNADGHGKNLSFCINVESGTIRLAPLYDTVPTALWPALRSELAMSVNGRNQNITISDMLSEANLWGLSSKISLPIINETLDQLDHAMDSCGNDRVADLVATRVERLRREESSQ